MIGPEMIRKHGRGNQSEILFDNPVQSPKSTFIKHKQNILLIILPDSIKVDFGLRSELQNNLR